MQQVIVSGEARNALENIKKLKNKEKLNVKFINKNSVLLNFLNTIAFLLRTNCQNLSQ
jgi:hypothetical protein